MKKLPYRLVFKTKKRSYTVYADRANVTEDNTIVFGTIHGKRHAIEAMLRYFSNLAKRYQPQRELRVRLADACVVYPDPVITSAGKWEVTDGVGTIHKIRFTYIREPVTLRKEKNGHGTNHP